MSNDTNDNTDENRAELQEQWKGINYDAKSGSFIRVTFPENHTVEIRYMGTGIEEEADEVHESFDVFSHGELTDLYRVPSDVVENPVRLAEEIFGTGFEEMLDTGNTMTRDVAIMYAYEHTEVTHENKD